jgi:hypothetical protein
MEVVLIFSQISTWFHPNEMNLNFENQFPNITDGGYWGAKQFL